MIGVVSGKVLFSDGFEVLIYTHAGVGYQVYCHHILPEGEASTLFISHIIRDNSEDLYGFRSLREKKLFELLITVKGVGPKSAFNVISKIYSEDLIAAIQGEQKGVLTKVSGVGTKAASQMILDLKGKIHKVKMYSSDFLPALSRNAQGMDSSTFGVEEGTIVEKEARGENTENSPSATVIQPSLSQSILDDTILACENLGFASEHIIPLAQRILRENPIKKTEQLIHLVLKEV